MSVGSGGIDDQIVRWQFESNGPQVLAETTAALDRAKVEVDGLNAAYGAGKITLDEYNAGLRKLAASASELAARKRALEGAAQGATVNVNRLGMAANAGVQGLEDLQYSVGGAMNNLGQMIALMGGSGGAIAVVTLLGVAINQLVKHWPELKAAFEDVGVKAFTSEIDTLTSRIKELDQTEGRMAIDTFELDQAKEKLENLTRAKRAFDALMNKQTDRQQASGKAFSDALVDAPGGQEAVTGKVEARLAEDYLAQSADRQSKWEHVIAVAERSIETIRARAANAGRAPDAKAVAFQQRMIDAARADLSLLRSNAKQKAHERVETLFGEASLGRAPFQEQAIAEMERAGVDSASIAKAKKAHPAVVETPEARKAREERERSVKRTAEKRIGRAFKDALGGAADAIKRRRREADEVEREESREADESFAEASRTGQAASRAAETIRRREQQAVGKVAQEYGGHLAPQLTPVIAGKVAKGGDRDEIVAGLVPQVEGRLRQHGVDEQQAGPAAREIVSEVMGQVDARLAGMGGDRRGAAARLANQSYLAGQQGQQRGADARVQGDAYNQFRAQGAAHGPALDASKQVLGLVNRGLGFDTAMMSAWEQQQRELLGMVQRQNALESRLQSLANQNNRQRTNLGRGGP